MAELSTGTHENLAFLPVTLEQSPKDSHPFNPEILLRGPGVRRSLPFTKASMAAFAPGLVILANTGPDISKKVLINSG
jgi:hypothetical protein